MFTDCATVAHCWSIGIPMYFQYNLIKVKSYLAVCILKIKYTLIRYIPVDGVEKHQPHQQYAIMTALRNTGSPYIILSVHSGSRSDNYWLVSVRLLLTWQ